MECEGPEVTAPCSNPFLQIWKGGIPPLYDTKAEQGQEWMGGQR